MVGVDSGTYNREMNEKPSPEVLRATRRAVSRIRSYGIDGPRPIEEIETLFEHEDEVAEALRLTLLGAGAADVAAAIHLVSLMRCAAVLDEVREVAFARPSGLDAKREAVEAMRRCEVDPDLDAVEKLAVVDALVADPDTESLAVVLEWPATWRRPALDAWLGAAGVDQLSAVEIALGIEPELDAPLLEWIAAQGSNEAVEVLQRFLAAADDKESVKQAKKALHRLRSQGVKVEESAAGGEHGATFSMAIGSGSLEDARAYVTSVDGRGSRLVWVVWRAPSGGSRLLQAVVDDTTGIREAEVATVTRKGFREYVEQMQSSQTVILEQVPVERASAILAGAAHEVISDGRELPAGFRTWATVAGVEPGPAGPPDIYEHLAATEVGADEALIDASMTLLREPHFQSWALEGAAIDAAAEEIHQAETSTLMISDEQRRARMQDAISDAVSKSFDDPARKRYRGRLEIMAGMLWDRGQHEEARQALAAAIGLTEIDDLFQGHAFARAVAHRGVWLAYQDKQRELLAERQRSGVVEP